jgi:hypothetical protein
VAKFRGIDLTLFNDEYINGTGMSLCPALDG